MINDFAALGVRQDFLDILRKEGINEPTPVQAKAIPEILTGRDIVVEAQTGTGKTLAFVLPMLEKIKSKSENIQGLIIAPTRELALQITNIIEKLAGFLEINVLSIYGGQDVERQMRRLKGNIHIVVGTPGRLLDHLRRKTINLQHISMMVIDEADQMLNMGFMDELDLIVKQTSHNRQTMLFSATVPKGIRSITLKHMKNPHTIRVRGKAVTLEGIQQIVVETPEGIKQDVFFKLIDHYKPFMAIIFCLSKRRAQKLNEELAMRGYLTDEIHGDLSQNKRESVMKKFRDAKLQFLVATDIAGRGLDIEGVTHVFSYDIPRDVETYIHRIGRTGRAGESGLAITLCEPNEKMYLNLIEQGISKKLEKQTAKLVKNYDTSEDQITDIEINAVKERESSSKLSGRERENVRRAVKSEKQVLEHKHSSGKRTRRGR